MTNRVEFGWKPEFAVRPMPMTYCPECGARMAPPPSAHVHDEAGLAAMRKNPLLKLLIKPDGTMNPDAPIILGNPAVGDPLGDE